MPADECLETRDPFIRQIQNRLQNRNELLVFQSLPDILFQFHFLQSDIALAVRIAQTVQNLRPFIIAADFVRELAAVILFNGFGQIDTADPIPFDQQAHQQ